MADTGSLGLLQALGALGLPPQMVLQILARQQMLGAPSQPDTRQPPPAEPAKDLQGGDSGASPPAAQIGDTTGFGNMSFGEAANAAGKGFSSGLIGTLAGPTAGLAAKGATTALSLAGVPTYGFGTMMSLLGALFSLGRAAEASTGKVAPETPNEAFQRIFDPKNWFSPPPAIPSIPLRGMYDFPDMPTIGPTGLPEGIPEGLPEGLPEGIVSLGNLGPDPNDPTAVAAFGVPGDATGMSDSSNGDSGNAGSAASSSGEGDN